MTQDRINAIATLVVAGFGLLWGFYWMPVRAMVDLGLPGAWGTVLATVTAAVVLAPFVALRWRALVSADRIGLLSVAAGGAAFTLYSIGLVYGRVAIIILLYFLTPVWSVLIARYVMGWHTPALRIVAIFIGIAGLLVMLSAGGTLPMPRGVGEWMSLIAGILWAVGTTGIRVKSDLGVIPATFVFAIGATLAGLALAPFFEPFPELVAGRERGWAARAGSGHRRAVVGRVAGGADVGHHAARSGAGRHPDADRGHRRRGLGGAAGRRASGGAGDRRRRHGGRGGTARGLAGGARTARRAGVGSAKDGRSRITPCGRSKLSV